MILSENELRSIIRKILIERKTQADRKDGTKVLGEPDATNEPMRDNPTIDQAEDDEIDEVNAISGGGMGGGPMVPVGSDADGTRSRGPQRHLRRNK